MSVLSRLFKFRIFKYRTSLSEELDDLHSELSNLQQNLQKTKILQRQCTKWFAIYAILIYFIGNICYYTLFVSQDFVKRVYAFTISFILAVLIYGIYCMIRWYFRTIVQMKEDKLVLFKERKQDLIEEVKTKETYAVAKNLLEKYGETITPEIRSPVMNGNNLLDGRQRLSMKPSPGPVLSPENGYHHSVQTPVRGGSTRLAAGVTPGRLPRAILPPQRTFWGAILDTIVGDGPSKRYALICKSCNSHNGMALDEEFEYISFRCAYCNYFNSARKEKPVFNPDLLNPIQTQNDTTNNIEPMDMSITDSNRVTRRSIRIPPATNDNPKPIQSRSLSVDNKRQLYPTLTSSEESLSDKDK